MAAPILMVVDEDQAMAEALGGDLGRRFGVDYRILTESSAARALALLERLAADSQQVALVFAREWESRSHQLREILTRLAFPYRFHPHDSEEGRRLLAEAGQDGSRLPVAIFRTGRVLVDPSHAELAELLGASTRPQGGRYDLAIVGAGPAGLAAVSAAPSGGWAWPTAARWPPERCCWRQGWPGGDWACPAWRDWPAPGCSTGPPGARRRPCGASRCSWSGAATRPGRPPSTWPRARPR